MEWEMIPHCNTFGSDVLFEIVIPSNHGVFTIIYLLDISFIYASRDIRLLNFTFAKLKIASGFLQYRQISD